MIIGLNDFPLFQFPLFLAYYQTSLCIVQELMTAKRNGKKIKRSSVTKSKSTMKVPVNVAVNLPRPLTCG